MLHVQLLVVWQLVKRRGVQVGATKGSDKGY